MKKIKRALISVTDKTNLEDIVKILDEYSVEIISTGGTAEYIKKYSKNVVDISVYNNFPEILGGRVKTLNPSVYGGILAKRDDEQHLKDLAENGLHEIDLVIVNLYKFTETIKKEHDESQAIEKIDIGGPTMIRAAAKNFNDVVIISDVRQYPEFVKNLNENTGSTNKEYRRKLAALAFSKTRDYDIAIANWFNQDKDKIIAASLKQELRYGENPHQTAKLYKTGDLGIVNAKQIQGKELSYNNINDADAAFKLAQEFNEPCCCIIKHMNPCGLAQSNDIKQAYLNALSCDPISSFGGIVVLNREINAELAEEIKKIFYEVIIAPSITSEAAQILKTKKNMRVLIADFSQDKTQENVKSVISGLLVQAEDDKKINESELEKKSEKKASVQQIENMLFAWKAVKHVKSNAVLFACDNKIIAIGAGQMSRVDSVRVAIMKLEDYLQKNNINKENLVLASDAFFPFADGLELAIKAGVKAVIQPGGSIRDDEVIKAADTAGIAMYFTGCRHFNH